MTTTLAPNLLQVSGLNCTRSSRPVLRDVTFSVRSGEILGLIGPNGSGKTTLFECLAAMLPCDGAIAIGGHSRTDRLFYMPDGIRPWQHQTVLWTVATQSRIFDRDPRLADPLIDRLDLRDLQHHPVGTLSKGESKRLNILLGLIAPQPLLLLDEPFDGLDLRQTHRAMEILREVANSGRTLLLSIHQLTDASKMCDRFVLLSHGRIVGEGTIPELSTRAGVSSGNLEEVFLALT